LPYGGELKPIILVDKSFIQSLSRQEAHTLNTHFYILITPILIQEMITDIAKDKGDSDDALRKLKNLADKIGGLGQLTITDDQKLFYVSLMGCRFGSKPGIPVFNPKQYEAPDGSIGCIIEETPKEKLIRRWQNKEITDEDIMAASIFLEEFEAYYSVNHHSVMARMHPLNNQFTNLDDLVARIDTVSLSAKEAPRYLESVKEMTHTPSEVIENAKLQWERNGKSHFQSLYPYAYFYIRLFLIYTLGLNNGLIPASKDSKAAIDILYFLYLPFCHAFCSGDKFHKECFKYFQRPEQIFIWGPEFKKDLDTIGSFINKKEIADYINKIFKNKN